MHVFKCCLPQVRDRISTFLISIFFTIYIMSHAFILEDKKWLILKLASYVYAYCIFYKFDCKWLHDIFVNLCMTIHIIVCSLWYRLYILLLSICWNLLINGWEYEEILNQMSLYELKVVRSLFIVIRYRTVTCENEPWKSCHFFDWFTCLCIRCDFLWMMFYL